MGRDAEWEKRYYEFIKSIEYETVPLPNCCYTCAYGDTEPYETIYECWHPKLREFKCEFSWGDIEGLCKHFEERKR